MRILLKDKQTNRDKHRIQGWVNLFRSRGHDVAVWNGLKTFDTFLGFRPDLYIGETNEEINKCIGTTKILPENTEFAADVIKYSPLKQQDFGITYVGGYKRDLVEKYLVPLGIDKVPFRAFGYGDWNLPQHLGICSDTTERIIYSGGISLNLTHDYNEKMFKVFACGGFCLSTPTPELLAIFDHDLFFDSYEGLRDRIAYFAGTSKMKKLAQKTYQNIKSNHTYFHRWKREIDAAIL